MSRATAPQSADLVTAMASKNTSRNSPPKSVITKNSAICWLVVCLTLGIVRTGTADVPVFLERDATVQSQLPNGVVYRSGIQNGSGKDSSVYTVYIPAGVDTLRGIFVHQHGCGMEGRGVSTAYDVQYQAFAKKWGLAIVGPDLYFESGCHVWRDPQSGSGSSLIRALEQIGRVSGHPELIDVPWLLWGHSGGGYWVLGMMRDYPTRVLASFCYSPAFDPQWEYPAEALKIPVMIRHAGANDINTPEVACWQTASNTFRRLRSAGGLVSIAPTPHQNHNYSFVRYMALPFYESVLEKRLPLGSTVAYHSMRTVDERSGWLGDTASHKTYAYTNAPVSPRTLSWLPDSLVATQWKEYIITGTVVDRSPPPPPFELIYRRLHNAALELQWQAWADIQSGIKQFNIYQGDRLIARFPETGPYQRFDTNGDDAIPMSNLPELKTVVTALAGAESEISISTVNHFDIESPRVGRNRDE